MLLNFPRVFYLTVFCNNDLEVGRLLVAKMVEDVKKNYSARSVFSFITYKLLGGNPVVCFPSKEIQFYSRNARIMQSHKPTI